MKIDNIKQKNIRLNKYLLLYFIIQDLLNSSPNAYINVDNEIYDIKKIETLNNKLLNLIINFNKDLDILKQYNKVIDDLTQEKLTIFNNLHIIKTIDKKIYRLIFIK